MALRFAFGRTRRASVAPPACGVIVTGMASSRLGKFRADLVDFRSLITHTSISRLFARPAGLLPSIYSPARRPRAAARPEGCHDYGLHAGLRAGAAGHAAG